MLKDSNCWRSASASPTGGREGWIVPTFDGVGIKWRKSSASGLTNCVEVAQLGGQVGLRDSKHPDGPALFVSAETFTEFLAGIKAGDFFG
jgi:hypothetical protein